jgi:gamma-glutamylcyclotransferase (GGCT)/AIG2-like uncharacterized protein YtfP
MIEVFVYGTLKPNESNYSAYCEGKVINSRTVYTKGHLYHLTALGYPGLTEGEGWVKGILLTFNADYDMGLLDGLEDYQPGRSPAENEYQRCRIPIYNLEREFISEAWGYRMTPVKVAFYGGIFLSSGWWTGSDREK